MEWTDNERKERDAAPSTGSAVPKRRMQSFVRVAATRWTDDGRSTVIEESVLVEREFLLLVNGRPFNRQACTPGNARELAVGFLCSEGYISNAEEILELESDEAAVRASVRLAEPLRRRGPMRLPPLHWDPRTVMDLSRAFLERSALFRETGSVHSALIARDTEPLCFAEDLGRFNALDKCLGKALLAGADLARCALFTSGRLPLGIALKTIRAGIPLVVSRSAPTDAALELASRCRLQIAGFARGDRMTVYEPPRSAS